MAIDLEKYPMKPEVIAYLEKMAAFFPDDLDLIHFTDCRDHYSEMCRQFDAPIPEDLIITDDRIAGSFGDIPIRTYQPLHQTSPARIIYFHGGGFLIGDLDTHHSICADIAHHTGYCLVSVEYHLAPEYPHPASFMDARDAFLALDEGHTVVVGDSAGGTLAAAICVDQVGGDQEPVGQVLIYPWLGGEQFGLASYEQNDDAPGLTRRDVWDYQALRSSEEPEIDDPTFFPLSYSGSYRLPPCVAFAAEHDPIRDDAVEYVRRMKEAGASATCIVEKGLVHGYLRGRHMSPDIADSFYRICKAIKDLGVL